MEPNGGGQVIAETIRTETQQRNQLGQKIAWPVWKVGIARIYAPHVGAKRTAAACRILIKGKTVLLFFSWLTFHAGNRWCLNRLQWVAGSGAADHRRG